MSQTADYGDALISGILSGQKFRQFQEDAKNTALQRKLLEQQYSHNAVMEPLLMAHQNAATRAEQSRLDGYVIANQLAKATFDDTVAEKKATRLGAEADSRVSTATETSRISSAESKARAESARAGQETLVGLQGLIGSLKGAHSFSAADVGALAKQLGIIGTSEADAGVMLPMYKNMLDQSVKQYENDKNFVSSKLAEQEAKTRGAIAQAIQHEVLGGRGVSDLFSQAEPETAGPLIAKLDAGQNLSPADYAKLAVSSDRRSRAAAKNTDSTTVVTSDPGALETSKILAQNIEKLYTQLGDAKLKLAKTKERVKGYYISSGADEVTADEAEVKHYSDQIKEAEARKNSLGEVKKTTEKTTEKNSKPSAELQFAITTLQAFNVDIDPKASDEDLIALSKALAAKGRKIPVDVLKKLRDQARN